MTGPISPDEVYEEIPAFVFEAFNSLIRKNISGGVSKVLQKDVVIEIKRLMLEKGISQEFQRAWLDVEPLYRKAGWDVTYEKPGWNEPFPAYYLFVKKK